MPSLSNLLLLLRKHRRRLRSQNRDRRRSKDAKLSLSRRRNSSNRRRRLRRNSMQQRPLHGDRMRMPRLLIGSIQRLLMIPIEPHPHRNAVVSFGRDVVRREARAGGRKGSGRCRRHVVGAEWTKVDLPGGSDKLRKWGDPGASDLGNSQKALLLEMGARCGVLLLYRVR